MLMTLILCTTIHCCTLLPTSALTPVRERYHKINHCVQRYVGCMRLQNACQLCQTPQPKLTYPTLPKHVMVDFEKAFRATCFCEKNWPDMSNIPLNTVLRKLSGYVWHSTPKEIGCIHLTHIKENCLGILKALLQKNKNEHSVSSHQVTGTDMKKPSKWSCFTFIKIWWRENSRH